MDAAAHPIERDRSESWGASAERAARRLAAITLAGALLGAVVGGVVGRLTMMLLAVLNPQATGVLSDDGFSIGQFTLDGSLQLLGASTQFGLIGAAVYAAVRGLMTGPRWFQVLSVSAGPAVVVGALLVHADGVDFTVLQPAWLSIALFVAIPAVYAGLLTVVAERWLRADHWFATARLPRPLLPLLLWVVLAPLIPVIVLVWATREWLLRQPRLRVAVTAPVVPWVARAGLTVVFVLALVDLLTDVSTLT